MKFANCHDTLLAHHAFASHLPQRLDHVASCYTDSRPWKRIFKGGGEDEKGTTPDKLDGDDLCKYNASDAQLTMLSWLRMQGDLEPERAVYEHDRQLAAVCREMIRTGIGVDEERKNELSAALGVRRLELQEQLRGLVSDPEFMPGKLDHVRHHLFSPSSLGARYVLVTPKGQASTANETLEGLRLGGNERHAAFASALLTWRVAGKIKSTYLDAIALHPTSRRAHYNWKPFGTVSGRLSCRFQSVPRYTPLGENGPAEERVREIYVPRAGHTFVYYDVSQAEMRLAAYLSADPVFIAACDGDVHANNAKAVFPEVAARGWLDGDAKKTHGKKFRDIAKNLGFAISYCAEAEKVYVTLRSKGFDVSMSAVSLILDKLHSAYRVYYRWVEANLSAVRRLGYMRTPFLGRIRWLGWFPKITDVANYPIQSGLADIVNRRTIELSVRPLFAQRLVAQVHDACIYEVPNQEVNAAKEEIANCWAQPIDTPGGKLILPIDLKTGQRWSEL
jgi:DNA polymerase-1